MRNPDWVRDEIILAMDLYVRAGRKQLPSHHEEVVRLSQLLNLLPIHSASARDENFRNPNGVSMILGNFLGIDPLHDHSGLSKNNQMQVTVWNEFIGSLSLLHRTAEAIQAAISIKGPENSADVFDEEDVFPEGHILTKQHVLRERNRAAVIAKMDQVLRRDGRVSCEVCNFDFLEFYGELGKGFAECHHLVPLAEAAFGRTTRLSDLAIVCANCHRMLHRGRPVLTVDSLKKLITRPHLRQYGGIT
jgi:5-methylcytosine-specific restriction protein A